MGVRLQQPAHRDDAGEGRGYCGLCHMALRQFTLLLVQLQQQGMPANVSTDKCSAPK
jgi:hypothetical protein